MADDPQTDTLTDLVTRLHRLVHNELESRLQPLGASVEQWRVLDRLSRRDGYSMGELAGAVMMNHPALTKMIDRMVSNGLVHRAPDPADQRRVLVYSTNRGAVLAARLRPVVEAHETTLHRLVGTAGIREIRTALKEVGTALKEQA